MTLNDLMKKSRSISILLTSGSIPIKMNGEDFNCSLSLDRDEDNNLYVNLEIEPWISVDNSLPDYDVEVFVCDMHNKATWLSYRVTKDEQEQRNLLCDKNDFRQTIEVITHWMPIPKI